MAYVSGSAQLWLLVFVFICLLKRSIRGNSGRQKHLHKSHPTRDSEIAGLAGPAGQSSSGRFVRLPDQISGTPILIQENHVPTHITKCSVWLKGMQIYDVCSHLQANVDGNYILLTIYSIKAYPIVLDNCQSSLIPSSWLLQGVFILKKAGIMLHT